MTRRSEGSHKRGGAALGRYPPFVVGLDKQGPDPGHRGRRRRQSDAPRHLLPTPRFPARSVKAVQSAAVTALGSDNRFSWTAWRIAMIRGTSASFARRIGQPSGCPCSFSITASSRVSALRYRRRASPLGSLRAAVSFDRIRLWRAAVLCPSKTRRRSAQSEMCRLPCHRPRAEGSGEPVVARYGGRYCRGNKAALP